MLLFSVFVLKLHINGLTASNYTLKPDVLLFPPAPFFSFKYIDRISTINDISKGIDLQAHLMNGEVSISKLICELLPSSDGDVAFHQICKFLPKCHINCINTV
ncbi:uncharacterized protein CELE_Y51A2B.9 [Caenorhabditis elegans]|uniref:Domain of unknown function WSN domain-containing protein n=1 Tax=Caenorhabditis elegans TaxID=6239 RepID=A8DZ47_CAEEL|nr:protein of unknown function WSN domain-containing protein [Caenorhabditis elegans]CAP09188.1 Domain of unknown function WSN domain-containing protein [Caenorhabditis elegans]|eukprot:NP_001123053.1 Uncharacterized protein CELE_Y51A2B.9 [Caenorhabditis elegans]